MLKRVKTQKYEIPASKSLQQLFAWYTCVIWLIFEEKCSKYIFLLQILPNFAKFGHKRVRIEK